MPFTAEDWRTQSNALAAIYRAEQEVASRHLSQHRHFIIVGSDPLEFVSAHSVYLGLKNLDMRSRNGKTQNIRQIAASIGRHGYIHIEQGMLEFAPLWSAYENSCTLLGRPPSGGTSKPQRARSFFVSPQIRETLFRTGDNKNETYNQAFQQMVTESLQSNGDARRKRLKTASRIPKTTIRTVTTFVRNPDVIAERLEIANGTCETCKKPAPFIGSVNNRPFLEVHHVVPLSLNGEDTVENTKALCPNCHRKAHYG